MNKSLMSILACPIDKHHPLDLIPINEKEEVVSDGIILCSKCNRFYPIMEEIPIMLPDELRDKKHEIDFLKKYKDKIPENIITKTNPWHL
ncbi:MAG: Trm112 family protein [Nitrosopumilus sp.]